MAAKKMPVDTGVTQEAPTAPQARDAFGRLLDQWGLPVSGPCRVAALAEIGLPDPHDDPQAWRKVATRAALAFGVPAEPDAVDSVDRDPTLVALTETEDFAPPPPPLLPQTGEC